MTGGAVETGITTPAAVVIGAQRGARTAPSGVRAKLRSTRGSQWTITTFAPGIEIAATIETLFFAGLCRCRAFAIVAACAHGCAADRVFAIIGKTTGLLIATWCAGTAFTGDANTRSGLLSAADFDFAVAARFAGMGLLIADLAGIAAIAVIAAGAFDTDETVSSFTEDMGGGQFPGTQIGGAAQFLAITGAVATGIVTAFGMVGRTGIGIGGLARAAIGTAFMCGIPWTNTDTTLPGLPARTGRLFGGRSRTPGGIGFLAEQSAPGECGAAESEESFEYRAPVFGVGQCLGKRIETTIVHVPDSL